MFEEIETQTKSDIVKENLLNLIVQGKILPGKRLPSETELAKEFNVSRVTIREAIRELSTIGILSVRRGEGTFVAASSPDSYMKSILPMLVLGAKDVNQLYDARLYIEMGNAYFAAINRTEAQLQELDTMLSALKAQDYEAASILHFHNQIAKMSGNKVLYQIYQTLNYIMVKGIEQTSVTEVSKKTTAQEHMAILNCIKHKDASGAEQAMKEHILHVKKNYNDITARATTH